jgi:hypothetical protein
VIADPPSLAGAVQDTMAWELAAVANTPVGEPGRVASVTEAERADAGESPEDWSQSR